MLPLKTEQEAVVNDFFDKGLGFKDLKGFHISY